MKSKVILVLAAIAILVIGTAVLASNMGFKINIGLTSGGNSNWVSLPYYNSFTNASDVYSDITGCSQVSRWDNATSSYQTWLGFFGTDFSLNEGEAILVKVTGDTSWIVVGSHDPSYQHSFASGNSNWISVPYHTTATNASTLYSEITNCSQVSRWDNATSSYQTWLGFFGTDFSLTPGEGVLVKVSSASTWTPAHY